MYGTVTRCGAAFQRLPLTLKVPRRGPTTPDRHCYRTGLGSSPVARHYWGNHCYFLLLEVLRCFSSLRSPPHTKVRIITLQVIGLSHSEITGSKVICTYPALIAAYHVLHRLREPRHPPDALTRFRLCPGHTWTLILSAVFCSPGNTVEPYPGQSVKTIITNVFTYSLVCQYVKELARTARTRVGLRIGCAYPVLRSGE